MDWSRAKSILIIVFLILNIFLIVNLGITNYGSGTSRDAILNTVKILGNNNVTLTCEIPVNSSDIYKLKYENNSLDRSKISGILLGESVSLTDFSKESIELEKGAKTLKFNDFNCFNFIDTNPNKKVNILNRGEVEKACINLLKSLNINYYQYYTDFYKSNTDGTISIIIREKFKKSLFLDNYASFIVTESGIKNFECKYRKIGGISKNSNKNSVVPAYEILLMNFSGKKDLQIISIDLGWYIGNRNEAETKEAYASPVWRILMKNGDSHYFNAYSGDKIN